MVERWIEDDSERTEVVRASDYDALAADVVILRALLGAVKFRWYDSERYVSDEDSWLAASISSILD